MYTPKTKAEPFKKAIQLCAIEQRKGFDGPVRIDLEFFLHRPKAHFGTGKNSEKLKATAPAYHLQKPDLDNLTKAVFDALTTAGIWGDDTQVVESFQSKKWTAKEPGVLIKIIDLSHEQPA